MGAGKTDHEELLQLIDDALDGTISEADFLRLEARLHVDAEARRVYYGRTGLETLLVAEAEAAGAAGVKETKLISFPVQAVWGVAATLVALAALAVFWGNGSKGGASRPEVVATGFAVVGGQADAVWAGGRQLAKGAFLPAGKFHLMSGVAQIDVFSGVSFVVEGEAEFEMISAMEMVMGRGKLRANVPPAAHGFKIRTSSGEVVDLGTEFALDVSPDASEIHVIDGEVEWHPQGAGETHSLLGGQALRWKDERAVGGLEAADPARFVSIEEVENQRVSQASTRRSVWDRQRDALSQDSRTVLYFPMDGRGGGSRHLANASPGKGSDGVVVAAAHTTGRWEDKGAIDFSPTGSRVRLYVPGEFPAITLMAWVKIDSLDRWYNSLFLTDSYEVGEPHWQILDDGRIHFSIRPEEEKGGHQVVYSPTIWDTSISGRWIHLAVTYDPGTGEVAHYLNGEQLSLEVLAEEKVVAPIVVGGASIGNWSLPMRDDPDFAVRNLNGTIDEFALLAAALRPGEISEIYLAGKP